MRKLFLLALAVLTLASCQKSAQNEIAETTKETKEACMKKLFIVDPQNGFMDTGSLPVQGAQERMDALAEYLKALPLDSYEKIYVSLDWHPANHSSFSEYGGIWPEHCVAFTTGALVTEPLQSELMRWMKAEKVVFITKGTEQAVEEYSSLDNPKTAAFLREDLMDTAELDVCGVVGTVCVQNTLKGLAEKAIDASRVKILPEYIAQFSEEDEAQFLEWFEKEFKQIALAE